MNENVDKYKNKTAKKFKITYHCLESHYLGNKLETEEINLKIFF